MEAGAIFDEDSIHQEEPVVTITTNGYHNPINLKQLTFFIISGASRGIGREMAIECSKQFSADSIVILVARDAAALADTKSQILSFNPAIMVHCYANNLARINDVEFRQFVTDTFTSKCNPELMPFAMIIHNVGTIGDCSKFAHELFSAAELHDYYDINVFSIILLNNLFIDVFQNTKKFIVNVTSACAITPYKSFTYYCTGKAARQMYFKVLADEQTAKGSDVMILNYSPGPVDTGMTADVQATSASAELREYFRDARETKTILTPIQTTQKFLSVLELGQFKSGDYVDYFE